MKTRSVAVALLLAVAPAAVSSSTAFAQSAADDATTQAARARFQEGVAFYDKGQYESARAAFLQAYALRKHPAVLLNLAQSSLRSGHTVEAANFFTQYLHDSTSLTPAQRADAEKGLAEAKSKLGRIEVTAPAGAEITIDSEKIGVAPLPDPVEVEPGAHKVSARNPDGTTDVKPVTVAAGQQAGARFTAQAPLPVAPVTPPPPEKPPEPTPPPPEEEPKPIPPPVEKPHDSSHVSIVPALVGFSVGAAGFIAAIVLGTSKSSAQSSANQVSQEILAAGGGQGTCYNTPSTSRFYNACSTLADNNNKVNADATGANVGVAIGIAGAVFGAGWLLFAPRSHEGDTKKGSTSFTPFVGPRSGGLGLRTSF